jgi:hypothetical protein
MCTLSVLRRPMPAGDHEAGDRGASEYEPPLWRVGFNRDERRTRPAALPPARHIYDERVTVHPIDPLGGGTWIAMSSAGLVFALLNGYSGSDSDNNSDGRARTMKSRGLIIPTLLSADTLDVATTRLRAFDPMDFLSFRLVIVADDKACEVVSDNGDGPHLDCREVREGAAWIRSSSSIRPDVVLPHRCALFEHEVARPRSAAAQDRFHLARHAPDPALGVLMERDDARTVSVTIVEVFATHVRMTYQPLEPDTTVAMPVTLDIARQPR